MHLWMCNSTAQLRDRLLLASVTASGPDLHHDEATNLNARRTKGTVSTRLLGEHPGAKASERGPVLGTLFHTGNWAEYVGCRVVRGSRDEWRATPGVVAHPVISGG